MKASDKIRGLTWLFSDEERIRRIESIAGDVCQLEKWVDEYRIGQPEREGFKKQIQEDQSRIIQLEKQIYALDKKNKTLLNVVFDLKQKISPDGETKEPPEKYKLTITIREKIEPENFQERGLIRYLFITRGRAVRLLVCDPQDKDTLGSAFPIGPIPDQFTDGKKLIQWCEQNEDYLLEVALTLDEHLNALGRIHLPVEHIDIIAKTPVALHLSASLHNLMRNHFEQIGTLVDNTPLPIA